MFTGIIEETGIVKNISGENLVIGCKKILDDVKLGDSVSINGVCETVTEFGENCFKVQISDETFKVTTFSELKIGDKVNLERALTLNSRLGGHIVSGHVDCKGKCLKIEKLSEFCNLVFELPENQMKYLVYKGSVTVNGISLTVASVEKNFIKIAVIPHTLNNTNLTNLKVGDFVNIETDILGKYVEKMLSANDNKSNISMEFLAENGFV